MAIQLCPVDTANVHPRNILGSSSSFDRERLSPFGSLSSRCWETVRAVRSSLVASLRLHYDIPPGGGAGGVALQVANSLLHWSATPFTGDAS